MNNEQLLQAMALDLKRAAIGYHSGSIKMADIFLKESVKKASVVDSTYFSPNLTRVVRWVSDLFLVEDTQSRAEYALTYSTILLGLSRTLSFSH